MAEGFLKAIGPELEVYSAGTKPAKEINPNTVIVMNEAGIDLSKAYPKDIKNFLNDSFDYVITVCDNASKTCPSFNGNVKTQLHLGFTDPAEATGTKQEILFEYRKVRDMIEIFFNQLYYSELKN